MRRRRFYSLVNKTPPPAGQKVGDRIKKWVTAPYDPARGLLFTTHWCVPTLVVHVIVLDAREREAGRERERARERLGEIILAVPSTPPT